MYICFAAIRLQAQSRGADCINFILNIYTCAWWWSVIGISIYVDCPWTYVADIRKKNWESLVAPTWFKFDYFYGHIYASATTSRGTATGCHCIADQWCYRVEWGFASIRPYVLITCVIYCTAQWERCYRSSEDLLLSYRSLSQIRVRTATVGRSVPSLGGIGAPEFIFSTISLIACFFVSVISRSATVLWSLFCTLPAGGGGGGADLPYRMVKHRATNSTSASVIWKLISWTEITVLL
jgi:hypothetical protein